MKGCLIILLVIPTLAWTKVPFRSIKATRETVENYELLTPVIAYKNDLLPYPSEIIVEIPTSTINYTLILSMNHMLMPGQFQSVIIDQHGNEIIDKAQYTNCFYQGEVQDHPDWIATMSLCHGLQGEFGNVEDKENFFHLEPVDQINPSIDQLHAFYLETEYKKTKPGGCGGGNWGEEHLNSRDLMSWRTQGRHSRVRRQAIITRFVEWVIVNDHAQFIAHGTNVTMMTLRSLSIANSVDILFRPLNIRIVLIRVITFANGNLFPIVSDARSLLDDFTTYVRNTQADSPYDSMMLFTGIDLDSTTIGIAFIGTMCNRRLSTGITQDGGDSLRRVITIAAHELGHIFNMNHDDERVCACPDPNCIMSAVLTTPNPTLWSSCSVDDLNELYNEGGDSCLFNMPVPFMPGLAVCGDGIVGGNETCDCGTPAQCTDICCNATTCQVADGMECAGGDCCTSQCRLEVYGTECRESSGECDVAEYCLGDSNECPEDDHVANGSPCLSDSGYCMEGACPTHNDQCGAAFDSETGFTSCFNRNIEGNIFGNCGQNSSEYRACDSSDVLCGKLQCMDGNYTGLFGVSGSVTTIGSSDGVCVGFSPSLGITADEADLGLVRDGTKCGEEQVCDLNRCMTLDSLNLPLPCPVGNNSAECSGPTNGICTNRGTCSCQLGFTGTACEMIRNIADCGELSNPANGQVFHSVTIEGGYADYFCNPGFFLVGAPFRRCLSNGSWTDTDPTCDDYDVTLIFEDSTIKVMEPDNGETVTVSFCFTVLNNVPLDRDAVFDIRVLPSSNASINLDFYFNTSSVLTIEANLNGNYEDCIEFVVIGDNVIEGPETIFADVISRSSRDHVVYGNSTMLQITIADNIGNFLPFGAAAGDTELPTTDDGSSSAQVKLALTCPFFGQDEDTIFVNANGVLSFRQRFGDFSATFFPLFGDILVALFWNDINIGISGRIFYRFTRETSILNQVGKKIRDAYGIDNFYPPLLFLATWDRVSAFGGSPNIVNSFQVVLAGDGVQTYVMFLYKEIQWGRDGSTVGLNAGDGVRFYALDQPNINNSVVLERDSNVNEPGTYIFRVDQNQVILPSDCGALSDPANGSVLINFSAFGSDTAQYSCDLGFILMGEDTRVCLPNTSWSGMEPTCEACEALSNPPNGNIVITAASGVNTAQYFCDPGFFLVGEDTRECFENTTWSGIEPACREYDVSLMVLDYGEGVLEPPSGENVTVDVCFMAELDSPLDRDSIFDISPSPNNTATLGDDYLFNFSTADLTIPSGYSGTFSTCASIVILGDNENEEPETISYEVTPRSPFDRVVFATNTSLNLIEVNILDAGSFLPFGVAFGDSMLQPTLDGASPAQVKMNSSCPFFGQDEDILYVNANGILSFRAPFGDFSPDSFPLPSFRRNALVAPFWNDFDVRRGGNIFFRFSDDEDLQELVGMQIQAVFEGFFHPELLFIATWDRVPGFSQSAAITNSFQVVLASDGEQTYVLFLYREIQWGRDRSTVGLNAGDGVRFYALDQPNINSSVVLERDSNVNEPGTYIFRVDQNQVILPSDCGALSDPANGSVLINFSAFGSETAQYSCDLGFIVMGEDTRVCLPNTSWSGIEPTCEACEALSNPPNGNIVITAASGVNTAQYFCDPGFFLVGEDTRECFENTTWSGIEPTCREYDVSLMVLDYAGGVLEPPSGENVTVDVCFMAELDSPLNRDSTFDISPSPNNTATLGDDYLFNFSTADLTIPSGFSGTFSTCASIVILGDNENEEPETISYEVTPRSSFDRVVFATNTSLNLIEVNILDADILLPFGEGAGDASLRNTDDGSSSVLVKSNLSCFFFGQNESTLYVNANGHLSFGNSYSAFRPVPFVSTTQRLIAPFWNDIDITNAGSIFYRFSRDEVILQEVGLSIRRAYSNTYYPIELFIATWDSVARHSRSPSEVNTFQVVLANDGQQTFVLFQYRDIQWGRFDSAVGFSAGDGIRFFDLLDHLNAADAIVLESESNVGTPGRFMFRVDLSSVTLPSGQSVCRNLSDPDNGTVFYESTTEGSVANYSCDPGTVLVGDEVRVCLENGSWSGMEPVCEGLGITLLVGDAVVNVVEPDSGATRAVTTCFTAQVATHLVTDAIFDFTLSSLTTAQRGIDFFPLSPTLTIPSGFIGTYMRCMDLLIIGDDIPEASEIVAYEIQPRSEFDQVLLQSGSTFNLLRTVIIDNDGTDILLPFGEGAGDASLRNTDDGSSSVLVKSNLSCFFFGRNESTLYVNANGHLSFGNSYGAFRPVPFVSTNQRLIAPFWNDIDITNAGSIFYRFSRDEVLLQEVGLSIRRAYSNAFYPIELFIATWDSVARHLGSPLEVNIFQVVLANDGQQTYVLFQYRDIQWGRLDSAVGLNAGDGLRSFDLLDHLSATDAIVLESESNVGTPGRFMFRVDLSSVTLPSGQSVCENLPNPNNGTVFYESTTEGSVANYSCDPGTVLVGDEVRVCLENGSWSGMEPVCEGLGITLLVGDAVMNVVEPDSGATRAVTTCFTAQVATHLVTDAIFDFTLSSLTTAQRGIDFFPLSPTLTIPSGFIGTYMRCMDLLIIGDDISEASEIVAYEIQPRSEFDQVLLQSGSTFNLLRTVIIDNDGTDILLPFGEGAGDASLRNTDDGSSSVLVKSNLSCFFFGRNESTLYVNANGHLSFGNSYGAFSPVPFVSSNQRLIAPFWNDIDITNAGSIFYRFSRDEVILQEVGLSIRRAYSNTFHPIELFIATWDSVARFSGSPSEVNTFQVVLANDGQQTFVLFQYRDIQWGRFDSAVGFSAGDGLRSFDLLDHLNATDAIVLESESNVETPGRFMFRVDLSSVTLPPESNEVIIFEQPRYEIPEDIGLEHYALRVCLNISSLRMQRSITLSTVSGTAQGGVDYVELRTELVLNVGESQRCASVIIREDQKAERDESFLVQAEGQNVALQTEVVLKDDDDISFNFTGDSPIVRNNHVTFNLSLGGGIVAARCAVLQRNRVLEETDCSDGIASFANLPPRFVELTPRIITTLKNNTRLISVDGSRNFRLVIGSRRRCSVHLINLGVTDRNVSGVRETTIQWGLARPIDVRQSDITFLCSLDGGTQTPCVPPMVFSGLSGSHTLYVRPPRNSQGCIRGIPRIFNF